MATIEIKYVDKTAHGHEHITWLGSENEQWQRSKVISMIERGDIFFVVDPGPKKEVVIIKVVDDRLKGKYVRTVADGKLTDNLLYLPPCPYGLKVA